MELVENMLKENPCYKAGQRIKVSGLMLHSVGCPQPSAEVFIKQMNRGDAKTCVHAFIDGDTGKVYQTMPWDYKAWHCGGRGNSTHIGVEMCEPKCIKYTGGASIACQDMAAAQAVVKRTCAAAVELFAFLCKKYGLDPLKEGVIVSHKGGHDSGIASGHGDPDHLFSQLNMDYNMDTFRRAVSDAMEKPAADQPKAAAPVKAVPLSEPAALPVVPENCLKAGSLVTLTADAVYYDGKGMPDWVKKDRWFVKSVSGDRAVIDGNESKTHAICSPVNVKYLRFAGSGASVPSAENAANPSKGAEEQRSLQQTKAAGEMTISDRGVELVAKYEGCRLEAYKCPAGVWTIGYGHTAGVKQGDTLPSKDRARAMLKEDLKQYGGYVNQCVKRGLITFPLNQNQFDALTSFCYNCGNGNLQKLVSGRDAAAVAEKILQYNKGGGKVLAGLARRREEERSLFLS